MAILNSVGEQGNNDKVDVKLIQAALNQVHSEHFKLDKALKIDGQMGKKSIATISRFQQDVVKLSSPDGRVDPGGKTINTLKNNIEKGLNFNSLMAIMAFGREKTITTYLPVFQKLLPKYHIDTPLRMAHFFAQVGHESLSFVYTQELASGEAYEGREDLGNTQEGDGVRFKGRGLIQLTGRANYKSYGEHISVDLLKEGNETLVSSTPEYAVGVSLWFWDSRKLNRYADEDDIRQVTRRVNGGYNGLDDRTQYLQRAKFFLL